MAILDIRGTHGSGKSWIIHQLLSLYGKETVTEGGRQIGTHMPKIDGVVLGWYRSVCGGCDLIREPDEVCRRVRLFSGQYRHTLLEGILVGHTFQRYSDLATELQDRDYVFLFLNTPLKLCLRRVQQRRTDRGKLATLNPFHTVQDWHRVQNRLPQKFREAGHRVVGLDYRDPMPTVLGVLHGG